VADIFREVDEELREDRAKQLWARYGVYVIGGALLIVAVVAAVIGWDRYQAAQKAEASAQFEQVLQIEDPSALKDALRRFADDTTPGYRIVARLQLAGIAVDEGDSDTALDIYRSIATAAEADPTVQDLAAYLAAGILADRGDSAGVDATVAGLTAEGHPLRHQAMELQAVAAMGAGETVKARTILERIVGGQDVSATLRARAAELLAALES